MSYMGMAREKVSLFGLNNLEDNAFEVTFADAIPLNELFLAIDEHFSLR